MEMGVGIHGEPGRRRVKLAPADAIAEEMMRGDRRRSRRCREGQALLFVNGFGGTPLMELYLMYNCAREASSRSRASRSPARWSATTSRRSTWPAARSRVTHARRRDGAAVGCAGAYGGAALGDVRGLSKRKRSPPPCGEVGPKVRVGLTGHPSVHGRVRLVRGGHRIGDRRLQQNGDDVTVQVDIDGGPKIRGGQSAVHGR